MSTDIKRFVGEDLQLVQKFENLDKAVADIQAAFGPLAVALEKVQAGRKEYPMLFLTEMVQATLAGRKTQTRRLRGLGQINSSPDKWKHVCAVEHDPIYHLFEDVEMETTEIKCPYGKPGDILWVRETWNELALAGFVYKADTNPRHKDIRWKPSIHMPKKACRLRLEITAIRVERLNEISEGDAISEGILCPPGYYHPDEDFPSDVFAGLWEEINGRGSWDANPWVWVIEFKIQNP